MKATVAVATVQGKAYFLIVNALRERNLVFLSLIPGEPVPTEVRVVITTEKEKHLINHEKVLVYDSKTETDNVINEVEKILQGKESYEKIVIGIDPGEVFGLAVIADGKVSETENCFSVQEILSKIKNIIKNVDVSATVVSVKIGNGVPAYKNLLATLDSALPPEVVLEAVSEAGTNRNISENKHRRGLRDIVSAIRIAGRVGYVYPRRKTDESNS
jgi:predicted RNase H-like nuclease (RuvC/YqgF family)